MTVNLTPLRREIRHFNRSRPAGRRGALMVAVRDFVRTADAISPHDTNRYRNGWLGAGNAVGAGPFKLHPILPSKYLKQYKRALHKQIARFTKELATERTKSGKVKKAAANRLRRAREELAKLTPTSIVIGARGGQRDRRLGTTVRATIYGGTGKVIDAGNETIVVLHNREPHSTIIEANHGVRRRAGAAGKAAGVRNVSRAYIRKVAPKVKV